MERLREQVGYQHEIPSDNPERDHRKNSFGGVLKTYAIVRAALTGGEIVPIRREGGLLERQRKVLRETGSIDFAFQHFLLKYQRDRNGRKNPAPWTISFHEFEFNGPNEHTTDEIREKMEHNLDRLGISMVPFRRRGVYALVAKKK